MIHPAKPLAGMPFNISRIEHKRLSADQGKYQDHDHQHGKADDQCNHVPFFLISAYRHHGFYYYSD
jgi:hypothetical protein